MSLDVQVRRKWEGFSLDMQFDSEGGTIGILGASGCGKSMTLKCIAGIETPAEGRISLGDRVLYDSRTAVNQKPQQRRIGYLFQNYALFPHMSVAENINCALGGVAKSKRAAIIQDMLCRFQLEGLSGHYPGQLSGGQQQRVALARILAYEPDALLLDEPFSALDYHLKEQLQLELIALLREYLGDVVIVTHSRDEAYHLCKQLAVMENGRCIAKGNTQELFRRPGLLAVARLTGCKNFSAAVPLGRNRILASDWGVEFTVAEPVSDDIDYIGVRAHDFRGAAPDEINAFRVTVKERLESPFEWNILLSPSNARPLETVWWKVGKGAGGNQSPAHLAVNPESILLLRSAL